MKISIDKKENVAFITLENNKNMKVVLSTFGASFYDLVLPNKNNVFESIILTPYNLNDFYYSGGYYGKTVGRFSGRIDKAECTINNKKYFLDKNWNGVNSLHGGKDGISFQNFEYEIINEKGSTVVMFTYLEKEKLLPGDVSYKISYRVMDNSNDIKICFEANTNQDTIVNLTNHVYFNLSGNGERNCLHHNLKLNCDKYTKLNNELITESINHVNDVMDFRNKHELIDYIYDPSLQNHTAKGYDHCFIKEDLTNPEIAVLEEEKSGRRVTISTSYPAIVFYAGCYPKKYEFNENRFYIGQYHSVCLECQYIPNGINMSNVDKAILKKGELYSHYINYHFDLID